MFTAIIADDERNICILLKKLVNWEELGISLIGEYYNGQDLLEAIIRDDPDIVVTDILMPGMNGLDIVKNCITSGCKAVFLLISGHAQFEYAHMAIQYGVENYLLKPINQAELERNLSQICTRLNEIKLTRQNNLVLEQKLQVSMEIISQQFLNNLLFSPDFIYERELSSVNEKYHLQFQEGWFRLLAIKPDCKMKYNTDQYKLVLRQILKFVLSNMGEAYCQVLGLHTSYEVLILINYQDEKEAAVNLKTVLDAAQNRFYHYCDLTIGISTKVDSLFGVSREEALYAILCRTVVGNGKLIDYSGLSYFTRRLPETTLLEKYKSYLEVLNKPSLDELFQTLHSQCQMPDTDPGSLYSLLEKMGKELELAVKKECSGWKDRELDYVAVIKNGKTLKAMVDGFQDLVNRYIRERRNSESAKEIKHISAAKKYVMDHLADNITLNDIAEVVYMNPTYFSALFKKETGQNFSDYLVDQRIARAKELLKDLSLSVAEVGMQVGYQNSRYFSKVFLKSVGIKPSEYRRLYT